MAHASLVDEGWNQLTSVFDFGVFKGPKENSTTQFIELHSGISEQI